MPAGAIHKKVMKLAQKLLRTGKARTLRSAVRKAWREVKAKARESRKSYDRKRAQEVMRKRSKRAVTLDKKKRARTPLDFETWARRPGRYDWPGVDMPETKLGTIGKRATSIDKRLEKLIKSAEKKGLVKRGGRRGGLLFVNRKKALYASMTPNPSTGKLLIFVFGDTYGHREKLKRAGFKWNWFEHGWYLATNIDVERIGRTSATKEALGNEHVLKKLREVGVIAIQANNPEIAIEAVRKGFIPITPKHGLICPPEALADYEKKRRKR